MHNSGSRFAFWRIPSSDPVMRQRGRFLQGFALILILSAAVRALLLRGEPAGAEVGGNGLLLLLLPVTAVTLLLIHQTRIRIASHLLFATTAALLLALFWQSGGNLNYGYLLLLPITAVAALNSIGVSLVYYLITTGTVVGFLLAQQNTTVADVISYTVTMSGVTLFSVLTASNLQRALFQSRRLLAELQHKTSQLQKRSRQLQLGAEIGQKTGASLELPLLLRESTEQILKQFEYELVSIYLVTANRRELVLGDVAAADAPSDLEWPPIPLDETTLLGEVATSRKARLSRNPAAGAGGRPISWLSPTAAELALPLVAGGELVGVLHLVSQHSQAFLAEDVHILQIVANQLATHIANARLLTETKYRLSETRLLYNFNTLLTTTLDAAEIYQRAARGLSQQLTAARCMIFTWSDTRRQIETAVDYLAVADENQIGHFSESKLTLPLDVHEGVRQVLNHQESFFRHRDDPTLDEVERNLLERLQLASYLEIPLIYGEETTGLVRLFRSNEQPAFQASEIQLALAMSNQLAISLANADLTNATKNQVNQLKALNKISRVLSAAPDLPRLFEGMRREIMEMVAAKGLSISLLTEDGGYLDWIYGFELGREVDLSGVPHLPISEGFSGYVARSREMLYIDKRNNSHADQLKSIIVGADSDFWLGLPMIVTNELIGVLAVENDEPFTGQEVDLLRTIVGSIAIAIKNILSLDTVKQTLAQIQQNLTVSNHLYETSRRLGTAQKPEQVFAALFKYAQGLSFIEGSMLLVESEEQPLDIRIQDIWLRRTSQPVDRTAHFRRLPILTSYPPFTASGSFAEAASTAKSDEKTDETQPAAADEDGRSPLIIADLQSTIQLGERVREFARNNNVRGAVILPLFKEDVWFGTWILMQESTATFTPSQYQPFRALAEQASTILANENLLRQANALFEIGQAVNQAITREDALRIAEYAVARYIGVYRCRFILYDRQHGYGTWVSASQEGLPAGNRHLPMEGDPIFDQLNRTRKPILLSLDDESVVTGAINQYLIPYNASATLLIPAASQQELMGFLAIDSQKGKRPFTNHNIIFAQTVVDQLTTQIENIKLLDEALERAQELITLNQIQANIAYYLSLEDLAQAVHDQLGRLLDTSFYLFATYDAAAQRCRPMLQLQNGRAVPCKSIPVPDNGPLHQFLQRQAYQATDADHPLPAALADIWPEPPQSGLWMPLLHDYETVGLITIQSLRPAAYRENDIQLLRSVATQAGLAMINADLFSQIQAQNEKLMQLDQLKTQFLANMSHELRTPLNSIIGFSRIMLKGIDGPISVKQEEDLTAIYNNGQHLLLMINEILDMAKIEAGKMTLVFEEIDIPASIHEVRDTVRGLLAEENVKLIWDVPADLPSMEADPLRLRQILLNLLSNAAKFTSSGYVKLSIRAMADEKIHFYVKDTGIGIDKANFDLLFTAFEQVHDRRARIVGGTGLGLPITRWLVRMHQGEIRFQSEVDQGTTFHVILPRKHNPELEIEVPLASSS